MMPDDTDRDPVLQRHLVLLANTESPSRGFSDRVVDDLARRGLVRRSSMMEPRWLAAATVIFALGIGAGAAVASQRSHATAPHAAPVVIDRFAAEVNVPSPGKSEVWY